MIIFPAIDIIGGKPVRLYKGDFSTAQQVADDALETAQQFVQAGAQWIHMVDLDGSLEKKPVNAKTFTDVASKTSLKVEIVCGIRTVQDMARLREAKVDAVLIGETLMRSEDKKKELEKLR